MLIFQIEDLETAIQRYQDALNTTPEDHPDRAHRLQNFGAGYHDRYKKTGAMADLETAVQRCQDALEATPEDHLDRGRRLQNLAYEGQKAKSSRGSRQRSSVLWSFLNLCCASISSFKTGIEEQQKLEIKAKKAQEAVAREENELEKQEPAVAPSASKGGKDCKASRGWGSKKG
jgi:hypothetical protein